VGRLLRWPRRDGQSRARERLICSRIQTHMSANVLESINGCASEMEPSRSP
jgi:hypothetical protein